MAHEVGLLGDEDALAEQLWEPTTEEVREATTEEVESFAMKWREVCGDDFKISSHLRSPESFTKAPRAVRDKGAWKTAAV